MGLWFEKSSRTRIVSGANKQSVPQFLFLLDFSLAREFSPKCNSICSLKNTSFPGASILFFGLKKKGGLKPNKIRSQSLWSLN